MNAVTRTCDKIIEWTLLLSFPGIALAQSTLSYTSIFIKTTLLHITAIILFFAWAVRSLEQRRVFMGKPLLWIAAPAFAFLLSALLSFVAVSPSKDTSVDELVLRVPYFLIFFITAASCADINKVRKLFLAVIATAGAVSLYGLMQHFGLDVFRVGYSQDRISSFFGNPNVYVGFLTLTIPAVAAALNFHPAKGRTRALAAVGAALLLGLICYCSMLLIHSFIVHGIIVVVCAAALVIACRGLGHAYKTFAVFVLFLLVVNVFLTGSRSGLIGLAAAGAIFAVLTSAFVARPSRRFAAAVGAVALAGIALATFGVLRITHSGEDRLNTVSERKYYVKGALQLIREKPFLGNGIGTFKNNYPLVKPRESWAYNAVCFEQVSNVYNEFLEVLHDEGIVGFSIDVWLLAAVFIVSIKAIRASSRAPGIGDASNSGNATGPFGAAEMVVGLLSGVAALLIGNVFSLSLRYASTGFVFWLFLGLLTALASVSLKQAAAMGSDAARAAAKGTPFPSDRQVAWMRVGQAAAALIAAVAVIFSIRLYLSDFILNRAVAHSKNAYMAVDNVDNVFHDIFVEGTRYRSDDSEWEKAVKDYRKTLDYDPSNLLARYFLGNAFNRRWNMQPSCNEAWGDVDGNPRTDAERALEHYGRILRQAPHYVEIDFELGDLYRKLGDLDKAIACYNEYKKYKPFFTKIHYALAEAYAAKKEWGGAVEAYKDALDLNGKFTKGYIDLGVAYHFLGKEDLSAESYEKARELSPKKADAAMAHAWSERGEWDRAIACYLRRLASDSIDASAHCGIGWCSIKKQDWPNAIRSYRKAAALDSSNVSALLNLSNLYYQAGSLDSARDFYMKAIRIDPAYVKSIVEKTRTSEASDRR